MDFEWHSEWENKKKRKKNEEDYNIPGQMDIYEYMATIKPRPVNVKGLLDDAYCPNCDTFLDDLKVLDCKECPECGCKLDWEPWHRLNDEEENDESK